MNQGGGEPGVGSDSNSVQNHVVDVGQGHASLYPSTSGQHSWPSSTGPTVSWNFYRTSSGLTENGTPSSSGYHYGQGEMAVSVNAQGGVSSASHASTSTSVVAATATQQYAGYAPYPSTTTPYSYSNTQYQSYYYGYQQPANDSSSQQVGTNQNSGAAYQPLISFQNSAASYVHPTSYLGTYYNTGDHQTAAGYENSNYNYQTNWWNNGNSGSYPLHLYPSYTSSDTNSTQSSGAVSTNSLSYQQQYNQWPYYYSQSAPTVSCVPGTENTSTTIGCSIEGGSSGYPYPNNQPPPPGTTSWRKDTCSSGLPSLQEKKDVTAHHSTGSGVVGAPTFQNHHINQMPSYFQKPTDSTPLPHENHEDEQKLLFSQSPRLPLSSINQVPENSQSPSQGVPVSEARRVSKWQIPTNPRIASNLALGMPKTDKESSTTNAALKPAYISVSAPKPSNKSSLQDDSEAIIKGAFPTSLRDYVERTFARCKDDGQRSANQKIMKEITTNASADGTLFTRNWDIEPLFPLPNTSIDMAEQNNLQSSVPNSSLRKRSKSRWEPVAEEKLVDKQPSSTSDSAKVVSRDHFEGAGRAADGKKYESKESGWNGVKLFSSQQQTPLSKFGQRPVKKQRFGDFSNATENGDGSSDSDREQDLTKYYASAIALANSPEEKRRREHRYKRFERVQGNQVETKRFGPNIAGAESIYTRKASAMLLAKNYEDGCSRAVEDIDWDALTVKGTCQEIEKRYLRLTSAPDPSTVRTEEVLEKALHMVQTSKKNYLYKCDQLKSIRQDLTVQRIHNTLTVKVYETHARLALEAGDLPEFNQCQSQLKRLYAEGIEGCCMEFSAYNLLCAILHSNSKRDLLSSMARLSNEAKNDEAVKHALAVRSAVSLGNYVQFFRLYKAAPNLNTCLMDLFVEKMRFEAAKCMSKSYRPTIPVAYIARVLGFSRAVSVENSEDKGTDGLVECEEWLRTHGAILAADNNGELQLDSKASSSSLYMPEPEDAVAHGDASLAVDDFLTRAS